jgi:hypothetical protein
VKVSTQRRRKRSMGDVLSPACCLIRRSTSCTQ